MNGWMGVQETGWMGVQETSEECFIIFTDVVLIPMDLQLHGSILYL